MGSTINQISELKNILFRKNKSFFDVEMQLPNKKKILKNFKFL